MKKKWKFFRLSEFECPCCGENHINPELIDILDNLRGLYGKPIVINSGYRCQKRNAQLGGSPSSAHLFGDAVDIRINSSSERFELLSWIFAQNFKRIGIGKNFIHIDINQNLDQRVSWVY